MKNPEKDFHSFSCYYLSTREDKVVPNDDTE